MSTHLEVVVNATGLFGEKRAKAPEKLNLWVELVRAETVKRSQLLKHIVTDKRLASCARLLSKRRNR